MRRAGRELSRCLNVANEGIQEMQGLLSRTLRRTVRQARAKHARLAYLIRFATDIGYRKLSASIKVDETLTELDVDLDVLGWEAHSDRGSIMPDGIPEASA